MKRLIDGKPVQLDAGDVLGQGGEGIVFRHGKNEAVKDYHRYDPMREDKLKAMLVNPPRFRDGRGTPPLKLSFNEQGQVMGFVMERIGAGWKDVSELASKKYRDQYHPTTKDTARLFLDGGETLMGLHTSGYCVGDFSDANEQFQGATLKFVDVDAYQFGKFPCPVGTESFLDPALYGINLASGIWFKPDNDWYSYAVILFRSLLGVHPYGGTHRGVKQLTDRATQRITVLDGSVIYPKIGLPPDLLSDDLLHAFMQVFKDGLRGFSQERLRHYAETLVECPNCGATFPVERRNCPLCSAAVVIPMAVVQKGVSVRELFVTVGTILFSKMVEGTLHLIVSAGQSTQYYRHDDVYGLRENVMRAHVPGTRYDAGSDFLINQYPGDAEGFTVLSDDQTYHNLNTDTYVGTKRPIFRASNHGIFRIISGTLMHGEIKFGRYVERPLRPVLGGQTWFVARQDSLVKPTLCGFSQVFREQRWWLYYEGMNYDGLALTPLEVGETQTDVLVRFSSHDVLILRATQFKGVDYLHSALVDEKGKVTNIARQRHDVGLAHGALYAHGAFLFPTDDGLVQQKRDGTEKTFAQTKGMVEEGDTLYESGTGLIVVKSDRVIRIELG